MADWANTVVGLWDLAVRIANFANDIRSAQDDFVGLRAEAECLLICINSLNSPSCRDALYRYISADQATDLDTLVKNTDLNMKELNQFIAKCWRLVERDLGRDGLRRRGWRRLGMRLKQSVAKTWAKYWFAMADKQAYRDKLVLPAQSVNIYLTSLTHIGLVNVGFLMQLSGHGSAGGCSCACGGRTGGRGGGGGGRSGGGGGGGRGGGSGPDGDAPVIVVNPLHDWKAVGRQLAFKEAIARRTDLTPDLEEEIIAYALHLMNGGARFNSRPTGSGSTGGKQKVTKTTKTTKTTTRVRSRSRSRAPTGGGMGRDSDRMYLVRKKSTSKPSASRVEIVDLEASDSDDDYPRRPLLALPAPETPSSGSGPRVIEIKPPRRPSGSSPSDGSDSSGPGRRPQRSPTPSPPPSPPVITASGALHPDDDHSDTSARRFERMRSSRARHTSRRTAGLDMSREELQARRRMVLERIQAEADAAAAELEAKQAASRDERRRYRHEVRQSSGSHHQPSPQQEQEEDKKDDILEMCSIIEEEYGVRVIPLPEGTREPIFAPKVKPAVPLDDDEVESEHSGDEFHIRKEKKNNGRRRSSARNRRTAVESSASDGSEEEDEILVKSMSRRQNSRLKAETSLLGSTLAGHSYGPRTFGYEDPYVRSRSHSYYPEPASYRPPARFEPYPTRPYDRTRERERRHSEYPSAFFQDEKDIGPRAERKQYLDLGLHPGYPRMRSRHQPNVRDDSEDDSLYGSGRPVPGPKGPDPAPPAPSVLEIHRSDEHMEDIVRERELRRAHEREGPSIRIVDHPPSSLRPRVYQHRSAPGDIQHPEVVIRRDDSGSEDDYDQRVRMVRS